MRIAVDHLLTVDFAATLPRVTLALRVTPEDYDDQTVSGWRIGPDCDARLRPGRDGFGNVLTMLYAEGPLDGIEIHVTGEVFTGASSGVLSTAHAEPLPPAMFLRPGLAANDLPDIAALAIEGSEGAGNSIERLHLLNGAVHRHAAGAASGVLAETFVAAARRLMFPARCVSGYLADGTGSRPHHWAEAYVPRFGWIGFDPSTALSAGEDHAQVASARDLAGVAMVSSAG